MTSPPARRSTAARRLRAAHVSHRRPDPRCPLCLRAKPIAGLDLVWISRRPF